MPCLSVRLKSLIQAPTITQSTTYGSVTVNPDTVQRFTVDVVSLQPPPQPKSGEAVPQSRRLIAYNTIGMELRRLHTNQRLIGLVIDPSIFSDIQTMETYGDYGSKIQTLVRHLLYLKITDVGAKSIVFSAWADSLHSAYFILLLEILCN